MDKENGETPKEIFNDVVLSSLPKGNGWGLPMSLYQFQGYWNYPSFLEGIVSAQNHFKPQPLDIVVCSAPKTGTTWLKSLTFAVMTRSSFDGSNSPLLTKVVHDFVPFLEMDLSGPSSTRDPSQIPLLSTHIPYPSLPQSIKDSDDCKIVYICRNFKDAFVSLYHHMAKMAESNGDQPISLDEAFELFCEGVCPYGPFWDHVLGYWRASLELPNKVLFLKYEELKQDPVLHVKRLAEFIGYPFSLEEEENGLIEKIVKMCSFESLSNLEVNKTGQHRELGDAALANLQNSMYFRKGKVGDWKNHLTVEMATRLDHITQQKLQDSGLIL